MLLDEATKNDIFGQKDHADPILYGQQSENSH